MIKPSIQFKLGQQLAMTPQLQQAIRLLQYSTLELQTHIQEILESNPLLDSEDESDESYAFDTSEREEREDRDANAEDTFPDELPVDSVWEDIYEPANVPGGGSRADSDDRDPYESQGESGESLIDHLLWQIHLTTMSEQDHLIAVNLIDAIDEDGYLQEDLSIIQNSLVQELGLEEPLDIEDIEAVLHLIQRLDPPGCGARNLSECLRAQLAELPAGTPGLQAARELTTEQNLELLANQDLKTLMRRLDLDETAIQNAIALIHTLNPRPGAQISDRRPEYIVPDVVVRKQEARWRVELNVEAIPRLRVNPTYAAMVKRADSSADNTYIKNQLQEARWFIKSLQSRNETLLRVASAIVEQQRGFLEYGDEAMKPLVLRDIAEQVEMHESTISRVTTQKYMHTPRGIYEFKYFFSSHVGTADGGECSAVAIRAMIRKLVDAEPGDKPLSDSKIAALLGEKGIQVARRTVAKYREGMNILSSSERKRLINA